MSSGLTSTPEIQTLFAPNFSCLYSVKISSNTIRTTLEVSNPGEENFEFQALLHTYLRLPSGCLPENVEVGPLKGLSFTDKVQGGVVEREKREYLDFKEGEVDRVYDHVPASIDIGMGKSKALVLKTVSLPNVSELTAIPSQLIQ